MFRNSLISTAIAATLAAVAFTASTGSASAHHRKGGFYVQGPGFSAGFGSYNRHGHRYYRQRHYARCNPYKALNKASRRGIRHAHIVRVGHRGVVVAGRKWGDRVVVGFAHGRHCPVRFIRAR